jgi:DNA-binding IscR family transcriptional regulator
MDCTNGTFEYRCLQRNECVIKEVWEDVRRAITGVLGKVSIEDMRQRKREQEHTVMYHI